MQVLEHLFTNDRFSSVANSFGCFYITVLDLFSIFQVSQFNLENVTVFNKDPENSALKQSIEDENEEKMEVEASTEPLTLEDAISKERCAEMTRFSRFVAKECYICDGCAAVIGVIVYQSFVSNFD